MTDEEAEAFLRRIDPQPTDPLVHFFEVAPPDDELVTEEEEAAVAEVEADRARGDPTIPFAEVKRMYR